MDQNKTNVPRERRLSKEHSNLWKLRTHLVGSLIHTSLVPHGKKAVGCFNLYEWPHDANLTCYVLLHVLYRRNQTNKLPPTLYLQLDNCIRENKNNLVFGLIAILIELYVFDKVYIILVSIFITNSIN